MDEFLRTLHVTVDKVSGCFKKPSLSHYRKILADAEKDCPVPETIPKKGQRDVVLPVKTDPPIN